MDCEAVRTADDVAADVVLAVAAFGRADLEAFTQATSDLDAALPCLGEAVDAPLAASVHRVQGIRAFVAKDDARLTAAFAAARHLEPGWQFPSSLVKPGHPLRTRFDAALPEDVPTTTVPYVAGGYLTLDGYQVWDRPSTLATLVQRFDAEGKVQETRYLWPDEAWLTYEVGRPATVRATWSKTRRTLFASSLGAGLVAGGLYGLAYARADAYRSSDGVEPVSYAEGDAWRTSTNALVMASAVTGAMALGLGGASVVVTGTW